MYIQWRRRMTKYQIEIESRVNTEVEAENEEEACQLVMESKEIGEELLFNAEVTDVEEIEE